MIEAGIRGSETVVVSYGNTAAAVGSGLLEVFSTPDMIRLMEKVAADSVRPHLEPGTSSVGTVVNIQHVSATPIGMSVRVESELTEVDRRRLVFSLTAYDEAGKVGFGTHERFIVDNEKFVAKAEAKKAAGE